ncbi:unnamed protein product [Soboliphyme baturini]|uniref:Carm_PH domain-containing protein n=1 Tax=Soboliphyme baturini TaxID=241478 RepID=A0A183ID26_9BILA|nr:unnamed protein product [Soboliphyme baturini]
MTSATSIVEAAVSARIMGAGDDSRTYHDVISTIRGNCKQILGAKFWNISFICPVDASWKNEKPDSKIFILSKFRLFVLSYKSAGRTQIEHCHNILALTEIFLPDKHEILLDFSGRKLHMRTCDHEISAADILMKILQAYKHYFPKCDLR